ncbi:DUF3293 domain-containing protein [Salinisphaera sp. RV14]|uniref:DUF3293 domain-containing protein n=1 Tax=unclassified Salinisphaera TaxID=2649847 RepID=UPI003F825E6E
MRQRSELSNTFQSTDYCVEYRGENIVLNLYRATPATLADWVSVRNGATPAWLITAYNPGAEAAAAVDNRARHQVLDTLLKRRGFDRLAAVNRDTAGDWPNEPGWLVAGMEEGMARNLARRFGQVAIVAVDRARVDLVWIY